MLNNVALRNDQAGCGALPGTPNCTAPPTVANFDLLDSNNVIVCPSFSASTQSLCASLGFGPPPSGPLTATRVVVPGFPACDSNVWSGNVYGTAFPPCTAAGGRQVPTGAPAPTARSLVSGTVAEDGSAATTASPAGRRVTSQAQRGHRTR